MVDEKKIERARQLCAEVANILDEVDFGHDIRHQTRDFAEGRPTADRGGTVEVRALEWLTTNNGRKLVALDCFGNEFARLNLTRDTTDGQITEFKATAQAHYTARISSALATTAGEATHRHVKTGGEYTLLGIGKMQAANWCEPWYDENAQPHAGSCVDMREVAIYRGADGQLWARPREEFEDGRFASLVTDKG